MRSKVTVFLSVLLLTLLAPAGVIFAHGGSGGGDEDRVRVEVRTGEDEPEENRVRVEIRGEDANVTDALNLAKEVGFPEEVGRVRVEQRDDRVRVEVRAPEVEEVEDVEDEAEMEVEVRGTNGTSLLSQILAFFQNLM